MFETCFPILICIRILNMYIYIYTVHDLVYYVFLILTAFQFPPWQAAFPLGRHLQEQVCRGAAFFCCRQFPYATPRLSLWPPGCWPQKRCPTCKSGRWKPLFQERIGMQRYEDWDDFLQNRICRFFKQLVRGKWGLTLGWFDKLWFGTTL